MKAVVETVKTDNFTMGYCRFGEGKRAMALIPGLSIVNVLKSADAIADAYQVLAKDFAIYVFERRNDLPAPYRVDDTARDTVEAIHVLGLKNICLCGASYGGMTAMTIAAEHPELVEKVVVASTSAHVTEEDYKVVGGWVSLAKEGKVKELCLAFGEALYNKSVFEASKDLLVEMAAAVSEDELKRFIILGEGMEGFKIKDRLEQIRCPLMVVGDSDDRVLGTEATEEIIRIMKEKPGFASHIYDGYGHAVFDLAPDFKERVLQFLRS
ncbi:MAG: alpha/beta hydrolase [Lachnospiraceae bacterium]|nr:alpha/beta hydrolase [Lachnospiraceae bacterium]